MRLIPTLVSAVTGAVVLLAGVGTAAAQEPRAPEIIDRGHVDVFGVHQHDDHLHLHVHGEEEYDPAATLLKVRGPAKTAVPDDPDFGFLGEPGADVWILPDHNDPELLFAGWGAEEIDPGQFVDDELTLSLHDVDGAGEFAVYTVDAAGDPELLLDSDDEAPNTITMTAGGHGHVNWGFSDAGFYRVTVSVAGTLAETGETIASGETDFWFYVEEPA